MNDSDTSEPLDGIAIVGMAGRFPGAHDVEALWVNLLAGRESIRHFAPDELEPAHGEDRDARGDAGYVRARGILDGIDLFDHAFFGFTPAEAALLDPQHRLFLQAAWEALEHAGHGPGTFSGPVGVYAGGTANSYYLNNLRSRRDVTDRLGLLTTQMGNQGHYIATRVAYKLDLKGPALNIHTACSTSLVAVCTAVQALQAYQCDMALAGGVSITVPQQRGYLHQEGSILSPDGHCRAFDADAAGTVFGNGLGIVVLRRLQDALADGDTVYAVIKGAAVNNDGHGKLSFTAPSVDGQAEVVAMAHALAGIDPSTIGYVETHGTGTALGDPIELAALTQAFRAGGATAAGTCALGSLKTNIGHLDAAAGVAGLIKATLSLHHRRLPASLHFQRPNPELNLDGSPFYVNDRLRDWPEGPAPRRAGVSSFGVGGTNAHVVLEEAPARPVLPSKAVEPSLLVLSARDEPALARAAEHLTSSLEALPDGVRLADVAHTLQVGRQHFARRRAWVAADAASAHAQLQQWLRDGATGTAADDDPGIAFVFPGQGSQQVGMGRGLYESEPVFRAEVDAAADVLHPLLGLDVREVLYPPAGGESAAAAQLQDTALAQPALFAVEHALARLWMSWGIEPSALIGHSVGEYVAACLAGTFRRDDALRLVARRAALMQGLPRGAMLAVRAGLDELPQPLDERVGIAAVNGSRAVVLSGETDAIETLARACEAVGTACRRLATSHAFHSPMMAPIADALRSLVAETPRAVPHRPWVSGLTGRPITAEEAVSPGYWADQMRLPVQFGQGLRSLIESRRVLLEVGPGHALCRLSKQQGLAPDRVVAVATLPSDDPDPSRHRADARRALGQLWEHGARVDWSALRRPGLRRVPLPTYPFDLHRHWIEPARDGASGESRPTLPVADPLLVPVPVAAPAASQTLAAAAESEILDRIEEFAAVDRPTASGPLEPVSASRLESLRGRLLSMVAELAGLEPARIEPGVAFLELGFDSLLLTQVSQNIGKVFGMKLPMRTLLEDCPTVETLALHLHALLPPDALPRPVAVAAVAAPAANGADDVVTPPAAMKAVPAGGALTVAPDGWSDVLQQQLALMARQLDVLQALGHVPKAADLPAPPPMPAALPSRPGTLPPANVPPEPADPVPSGASAGNAVETAFGPYRPPVRQALGAIAAEQRDPLRRFIERYNARTAGSKRLTEQHRGHLADPRSVAGFRLAWKELVYPIVTLRSEGSRLWDMDGHEYVDLTNGFGMILFGHNPPFIREAIQAQLHTGYEIGPQTPLAGEVAERICRMVGLERAAFCGSGSEAVTAAIRVARTVTGRDTIVMFNGSYHGIVDEVLARPARAAAAGPDAAPSAVPIAPGIPAAMTRNIVVLEYGSEAALQTIRELAPQLAAVLVEPVQSRRPELQPRAFLHELRTITQASGTALVFDEVVTGFRVHPAGAQAFFGVRADIATYGKVVGGGLPIGIVAGSARFLDALDGGTWRYGDDSVPEAGVTFFAGTFVRHPLALAAARAVLERLQAEGPELQRALNLRTTQFVERLQALVAQAGVPLAIPHFASWFCFQFTADSAWSTLFFAAMRMRGVHVWEGRPCFLTLAHTDDDLDRVAQAVAASLEEMQQAGFLSSAPAALPDLPPLPGARRGRDAEGHDAWFVPDPERPGKYLQIQNR